jgi:hypothetical protein
MLDILRAELDKKLNGLTILNRQRTIDRIPATSRKAKQYQYV